MAFNSNFLTSYNTHEYTVRYGGMKMVAVHTVDNVTFIHIDGSVPLHAWGLGGWVADHFNF